MLPEMRIVVSFVLEGLGDDLIVEKVLFLKLWVTVQRLTGLKKTDGVD